MSDHGDFLDRGLAMTTPHPLGERIVRAEGVLDGDGLRRAVV